MDFKGPKILHYLLYKTVEWETFSFQQINCLLSRKIFLSQTDIFSNGKLRLGMMAGLQNKFKAQKILLNLLENGRMETLFGKSIVYY
jgi:hypothetical protein